jgi:hypothetical protein
MRHLTPDIADVDTLNLVSMDMHTGTENAWYSYIAEFRTGSEYYHQPVMCIGSLLLMTSEPIATPAPNPRPLAALCPIYLSSAT